MDPSNTVNDDDTRLSVLVVHNHYRWRGGEDSVVAAEIELLRAAGHDAHTMLSDSRDVDQVRDVMWRPHDLVFNREVYQETRALIRRHRVRVVHCHNLVPRPSTSVYAAAVDESVPIIQTVHNYRIGCLNGLHLYQGRICERCRPGHYLPGIIRGCYRGLHLQSLALGMVQQINHWRGVWHTPTRYIAPSQFVRTKLIDWGIAPERVIVKSHFVADDPGPRFDTGSHALFVGRLSPEKGLDLLIDAWDARRMPLVIVGDGPMRAQLEARVRGEQRANIRFAGYQDRAGVNMLLQQARVLLMPSNWFETFGLVLIEAYAYGVPVIATRMGAMAEAIRDGVTGLFFEADNREDLRAKLDMLEFDSDRLAGMRRAARQEFELYYTAQSNIRQLERIYADAIQATTCQPQSLHDCTPRHLI